MRQEIEAGLSADEATRKSSSLQMEITHLYNLCDGTEQVCPNGLTTSFLFFSPHLSSSLLLPFFSLLFFASFARLLPFSTFSSRHVQGDYLGLDLGGTNFRVLYMRVGPGGKLERNVCRFYNCTEEHLTGTAEVVRTLSLSLSLTHTHTHSASLLSSIRTRTHTLCSPEV